MSDIEEWAENPMERDYFSLNFNCYTKGPGARIPIDRLPAVAAAKGHTDRLLDPLKLYVAQIPLDMTDNGLRNYMSSIGCPKPAYLRLLRGKIGSTPCLYQYAFLTFESTRDASEALQLLNRKEPYFFKVNFANKPGEKERVEKLRESQIREVNIEKGFEEYLKSKRTLKNQWQQCTTFTDDNDSEATTLSYLGLDTNSSAKPVSDAVGCDSEFQKLINCKLIKFLESRSKLCNYCSMKPYIDHVHYIIDEARVCNPLEGLPMLNDVSCKYCNSSESVFKVCEGCKVTSYCSKSCQLSDWSRHSSECEYN